MKHQFAALTAFAAEFGAYLIVRTELDYGPDYTEAEAEETGAAVAKEITVALEKTRYPG
jgi:hypothetical protein